MELSLAKHTHSLCAYTHERCVHVRLHIQMPPVPQLGAEGSSLLKSDSRSRWEIFFKARGLPASPCPGKLGHICEQL